MARLYYTCLIKALYMMKEFDVKLEFDDKEGNRYDLGVCGINGEMICEFLESTDGNYYVAKDSEHIFEPKDYDLRNDVDLNSNCEIIMRDDKHFFMPEVENE